MTVSEKKELLAQYWSIELLINEYFYERDRIRTIATKVTPTLSDMPKGNAGGDKIANAVEKLVMLDERLGNDIMSMIETRDRIYDAIDSLEDGRYKAVLFYRYIRRKSWADIECELGYNERYLRKLHNKALEELNI